MHRTIFLMIVLLVWLYGCSPGGGSDVLDGLPADGGEVAETALDIGPDGQTCEPGHLPGPDGDCMKAGVQGCAANFLDDEGICRPSEAACADQPGTIPKFDEGCVPVGIQGCAPDFIDPADGQCRPTPAVCDEQPGTIPKFDEGCVPVGIQGCAPAFNDPDDGLCKPSMAACEGQPDTVPRLAEGCVPVDGSVDCGEGKWPEVTAGPEVFYVDALVPDDSGDGSLENPAKTIKQILWQVPEGGTIVVAAGDYDEEITITKSVEIIGRCASMVTLSHAAPESPDWLPAVVHVNGAAGVTISGVTISGGGAGILAKDAGNLVLTAVTIDSATSYGIYGYGKKTTMAVSNCLVTETLPLMPENAGGHGLGLSGGAEAQVTDCVFYRNRDAGVRVEGEGTSLSLVRSVVEDTFPRDGAGILGMGILVFENASAFIQDCSVLGNRQYGVQAQGILGSGGGTANFELTQSYVGQNLPQQSTGDYGVALLVDSMNAEVHGNVFENNHGFGLMAFGELRSVSITGNLVASTKPQNVSDALNGGVMLGVGGEYEFHDNVVVNSPGLGLFVSGNPFSTDEEPTTVVASGNVIYGTYPDPFGVASGTGINVTAGAALEFDSGAVMQNHDSGISASLTGTKLSVTDSLIEETQPFKRDLGGTGDEKMVAVGTGIDVTNGAAGHIEGNVISANTTFGVMVNGVPDLTLSGNLITGTHGYQGPEDDSLLGIGTGIGAILEQAPATVENNAFVGNHVAGLLMGGKTTKGTVRANLVQGTKSDADSGYFGVGMMLADGVVLGVTGNFLMDNAGYGIGLAGAGTKVTVSECTVSATRKEDAKGERGLGVLAQELGSFVVDHCLIESSHAAAILVFDGQGYITNSVVRTTKSGTFGETDKVEDDEPADGIMVAGAASHVSITGVTVNACKRAGILFDAASGSVVGTQIGGNKQGLVIQNDANVDREDNLIDGNTDENMVTPLGGEEFVSAEIQPTLSSDDLF